MAKKNILVDIDFNKNQLLNPVLQNLSEDPSTGVEGQKYFNTTNHIERTYRNGAWQNATDEYELPAASTNTRGGIKVGNRLYIENEDVLNVHRASKVIEGIGRFATDAEVEAGTQPNVAIDPVQLKSVIDSLPTPMQFKGTLGSGGTITVLPTASSSNIGFLYLVISDGTYDGQYAKAGDEFISNGTNWILVPSGDEPAQIQADWNQTDNTALDYIKNKPTIPAAQVQADWNQTYDTEPDFIKNKPDNVLTNIPRILACNTAGSNQVKIVNITTSDKQILNNNDIVLFGILYDNTNTSGYTRLSFDNGATNTRISYENRVTGADHKEVAGIAGRISYYLKSGNTIRWLYNDVNPYDVFAKAQDITATDLQTAITNSTLNPKQFYYETNNGKLYLAISTNTVQDLTIVPTPTSADADKLLSVNSSGEYELITIINSELISY